MAVEFPPSPAPKYSYAISASCDRGDRHTMEDQICVYRGFTKTGELDFVLLGLFDGHAGEAAAQRAKEILPSKVDRLIRRGWGEEKALRQAFHDTNDQLLQEMNTWSSCGSIPSRSGTTACVVLLRRGRLWTANCGDSTCVLGIRVGGCARVPPRNIVNGMNGWLVLPLMQLRLLIRYKAYIHIRQRLQ
ncbi:hypothetical protein Y032_0396g683 [Ancylostoma ceylanicum]|uniref:PPM-type phosphatase domain-containing protein n=1 Tax=Ancylostoma ceylanicum TaxID=53326 RepID=A0A016RSK8_9BILA|nr:hypothetical protein Y032_0396g683 [Ancylostoma ceylanicum]